jgi:hypothetical protein
LIVLIAVVFSIDLIGLAAGLTGLSNLSSINWHDSIKIIESNECKRNASGRTIFIP